MVLAVFFYRDLWPLCTTNLHPIDAGEGLILWIHIGVLTFAAAVIPLMIPRQYLPLDPHVCILLASTSALMTFMLTPYRTLWRQLTPNRRPLFFR